MHRSFSLAGRLDFLARPGKYRITVRACLAGGLLCLTMPASADVLEIDGTEAHWIAGGPIQPSSQPTDSYLVMAERTAIPIEYRAHVVSLAQRYDLSPSLIEALVWQESRWQKDALSPKGARGLAQLMPATARYLQVDPDNPLQNLEGGARYLREQLDRFDGNLEWALAAYNAGPGRVERARGIPRIRETQEYVASIMARLTLPAINEASSAITLADLDYEGTDYHEVAYLSR